MVLAPTVSPPTPVLVLLVFQGLTVAPTSTNVLAILVKMAVPALMASMRIRALVLLVFTAIIAK